MCHFALCFSALASQLDHFGNHRRHSLVIVFTDAPLLLLLTVNSRHIHIFGSYHTFRTPVVFFIIHLSRQSDRGFIVQATHNSASLFQRRNVPQVRAVRLIARSSCSEKLPAPAGITKLVRTTRRNLRVNDPRKRISTKFLLKTISLPFGYRGKSCI